MEMQLKVEVIHKSTHLSRVDDPAKGNQRSTKCGTKVLNTDVRPTWAKVTCELCLRYKK